MSATDLKATTRKFFGKLFSDTQIAIQATAAANVAVVNNQPENVPFAKRYEGHDGLAQYVKDLKDNLDLGILEYSDLYADGNTVIGIGVEQSSVKAGGNGYEMPFVHVYTYDDAGKLVELRQFNNTHRIAVAFG